MARFKPGQAVSYRGNVGTVEAVDRTPGMVDVRYGRLVKRHSAEDLSHEARTNSGRLRRKARRGRKRRQRRREPTPSFRVSPPAAPHWGRSNPEEGGTREELQARLQKLERAASQAEAQATRAVESQAKFHRWVQWKEDLKKCLAIRERREQDPSYEPRPPELMQFYAEMEADAQRVGRPVGPADYDRALTRRGLKDLHQQWTRIQRACAPAEIALREREDAGSRQEVDAAAVEAAAKLTTAKSALEVQGPLLRAEIEALERQKTEASAAAEQKQRQVEREKAESEIKEILHPSLVTGADISQVKAKLRLARKEAKEEEIASLEAELESLQGIAPQQERIEAARSAERAALQKAGIRSMRELAAAKPEVISRALATAGLALGVVETSLEEAIQARLPAARRIKREAEDAVTLRPSDLPPPKKVHKTPPGTRKQQLRARQDERTAAVLVGDGRPSDVNFFVLPDPPRFEQAAGQGHQLYGKLCGNPIDSSMYVLRLSGDTVPIPTTLTDEMAKAARAQWEAAGQTWPVAGDVEGMVEALRAVFPPKKYGDFKQRGREWVNVEGASRKRLEPFTAEDVHTMKVGRVLESFGGPSVSGRRSREVGSVDLRLRLKTLERQIEEAERGAKTSMERREKQILDRLRKARAKVEAKIEKAVKEGRVSRTVSSLKTRQRRAKKSWGARTVGVTGEMQAATKSRSGTMFSDWALPAETAFFPVTDKEGNVTGYVAFVAWRRVPKTIDHLLKEFNPPYSPRSHKRNSPFFSWVPLRRPLQARVGKSKNTAFHSPPLCDTGQYDAAVKFSRELRTPVYTMGAAMQYVGQILAGGGLGRGYSILTPDQLARAGNKFLSSASWLSSWMQTARQTLERLPRQIWDDVPEVDVLRAVVRSQEEPHGIPVGALGRGPKGAALAPDVIAALSYAQLPLIRPGRKTAGIIGLGEAAGRVDVDVKGLSHTFVKVPFADTAFQYKQRMKTAHSKKGRYQEPAEGDYLIDRLDNAIDSRAREEGLNRNQALASLIVERRKAAGMVPHGEHALLSDLSGEEWRKLLFPATGVGLKTARQLYAQWEEAARDSEKKSELGKEYSEKMKEYATKRALRALFFVYHSAGGEDTKQSLMDAQTTLSRIAENVGRTPRRGFMGSMRKIRKIEEEQERESASHRGKRAGPDTFIALETPKETTRRRQRGQRIWKPGFRPTSPHAAEEASDREVRARNLATGPSSLGRGLAVLDTNKGLKLRIPPTARLTRGIEGLEEYLNTPLPHVDAAGVRLPDPPHGIVFARMEVEDPAHPTTARGKIQKRLRAAEEEAEESYRGRTLGRIGRRDRLYYTFNPALFAITKKWWNYATPWPKEGAGSDIERGNFLLDRIDDVGRYGAALTVMYEKGLGAEDRAELRKRLRTELDEEEFLSEIHEILTHKDGVRSIDPDFRGDARAELLHLRDLAAERLAGDEGGWRDWELLNEGPGGADLLYRQGESGTEGWISQMIAGTLPRDVEHGATGFADDPHTYLSILRREAETSLLDTKHLADTLTRREKRRVAWLEKKEGTLEKMRSTDPIPPLPEPREPPYEGQHRWASASRPTEYTSRFPQRSSLAALEYLNTDSTRLRSLIQQRLTQLSRPKKSGKS